YRGADAVAVDDRVEGQDLVLVDAAGGEDLHVTKTAEAELPTDLLDDPVKVAPARRGRVEPHRVEVLAERLRHADRLELLVLQGVDQGDAADFGIDDVVKGLERFHRVTDHQDERVWDRAGRIRVDQLRGLRDGDAVAATDERIPLDHRRERRVHPAGAERDHLAVARGLLAARRLGRDPGRLTEKAEPGRLVLR